MHSIIQQKISDHLFFIDFCLLPQPLLQPNVDLMSIDLGRHQVDKSHPSGVSAGGIQTPVGFPQLVPPASAVQKLGLVVRASGSGSQFDAPL